MGAGREVRMNASVVGGLVLLALAGVAFWGAHGGTPAVWLFPRLAAGVVAVAGRSQNAAWALRRGVGTAGANLAVLRGAVGGGG